LIEGDNYHTLQVLNYTHKGQIDVIYIDPPYNTGNKDFKYNDSFIDKEDGYRHSKWLNFMSKRLKLAHNLLKDDGIDVARRTVAKYRESLHIPSSSERKVLI
jgi:adenine-specific DNA-methyltransferase